MPVSVGDTQTKSMNLGFRNIDKDFPNIEYDYPYGLNLKPNSKLHKDIVSYIKTKATTSRHLYGRKFDEWNAIDDTLNAFIPLADWEEEIKKKSPTTPVSIVIPYSYAILETMISYMMSAFVQDPIFMYEGASPEDTVGAILLEKVIQQQCIKNKVGLAMHTILRDGFAYGIGIALPTWKVKRGRRRVKRQGYVQDFLQRIIGTKIESETTNEILYEGNALINVDPYAFFPDCNVPVHDIQNSEGFGWLVTGNLLTMLEEEQEDPYCFNAKYLKGLENRRSGLAALGLSNRMRKNYYDKHAFSSDNSVDSLFWYQRLVPYYWGLGNSTEPEKWLFVISADQVITRAERVDLDHGDFPIVVNTPEYDGHSMIPISRMKMLSGMQEVLNWMFNMHVSNVRRAVNNVFLVDPLLVNINDIISPKSTGGGLIRLRRNAWGRGVAGAMEQMKVDDVTRQHLGDSNYITEIMDQTVGTTGFAMGTLRRGGPERLTGKEFEGTQQGIYTRLERVARIMGMQWVQDLGNIFAAHCQQFMSQESYVKATGRWQDTLVREFGTTELIKVSPYDLYVNWDLLIRDGTIPGGNNSPGWMELLGITTQNEELNQHFDPVRIVKHIMRNQGAKNVDSFVRVNVAPDEQVAAQQQAGNLVPAQNFIEGLNA